MALGWIRFDTSLPDHPKVLTLLSLKGGREAGFVYCCGLAYAGKHGTDGFLPRESLARINGRVADADRLVEVGLWRADEMSGGWLINGWDEYQESSEETKNRRAKAQLAAAARWEKARKAKEQSA